MSWTTNLAVDAVVSYASPPGMIDRAGEYAINTPPLLLLRPTRHGDNVMRVTGEALVMTASSPRRIELNVDPLRALTT